MELKDIVCSLEHAKRLKELGVKQESLFYWSIDGEDPQIIMPMKIDNITVEISSKEKYSAFTASELLEKLPKRIKNSAFVMSDLEIIYIPTISSYAFAVRYRTTYLPKTHPEYIFMHEELGNKSVDQLAKMLIHLIENGLVEVTE